MDKLTELKNLSRKLMTMDNPLAEIEVDGKPLKLEGSDARSFGCGIQVALWAVEKPSEWEIEAAGLLLDAQEFCMKRDIDGDELNRPLALKIHKFLKA